MGHGVSWCGARLQTEGDKTPRRKAAEAEEHIRVMEGHEILQEERPALDHRNAQPHEQGHQGRKVLSQAADRPVHRGTTATQAHKAQQRGQSRLGVVASIRAGLEWHRHDVVHGQSQARSSSHNRYLRSMGMRSMVRVPVVGTAWEKLLGMVSLQRSCSQ